MRGQRTLAAVVFTDGVNFSARMSQDEEGTLDRISQDLDVMRELCQRYDGRVLKSTGDGLLMCFSSALNAVTCALEIQKEITEAASLLPPDKALQHRIGIHLGDVFISESDVMGTGVNIAARLQSQAEAGGICISQTVYDVVKTGISAKMTYIGPRKLKNIQEEIPIYRVSAQGAEETWDNAQAQTDSPSPPASTVTVFTPQVDPYDRAAKNLAEHEHSLRIRKLMLCVCQNTWENDTHKLNQIDLRSMVRELHAIAPTTVALKLGLYRVIQNLSKRAEYELVARIILDNFEPLYPDRPQISLDLLTEVAQKLEQNPNLERIKKLILCVCRDIWESDPVKLRILKLVDLLPELLEIAPTQDHLQVKLDAVVKTLNKQMEYRVLASMISQTTQPLYVPPTHLTAPVPEPIAQESPGESLPSPTPTSTPSQPMPPPTGGAEPTEQTVAIGPAESAQNLVTAPPEPDQKPSPSAKITPNWFDIRADLMRYTNPLRAKMLIFSVLHDDFTASEINLLSLRLHPLDALLKTLIQTYPTQTEVETKLYTTARQMEDPDLCFQSANSILQALRSIYRSGGCLETASGSELDEQTIVRNEFNPLSHPAQTISFEDNDATCQFFAPSKANDPAPEEPEASKAETLAG
ncbi:hypothetical protein BST81_20550 [Leptolyngbya sp. 'hensonii']|nr:hypothetical protein BST81_20550 [Leptolyngbya sp. 'hensonii']